MDRPEVIETVWIPMPDGTQLAARLWLPAGARADPVPCILEYIPYRRRDRTRLRDTAMHSHFAKAGYASIRVDIRGYGDSEGIAEDEYSDQETQDGVDVIAWLAEQPWCDGNVGMFGKSWGAYNSFQIAARRPPALKAIAPVMGCDDRWREDIHYFGGVLAGDNFWWGSIMQPLNALPPDPQVVGARWRDMWRARLEAMQFWPAMWLEHQTHDEMWRRGSICENYADVEIPVYYFGGWADFYRDTPFRIAQHLKGPVKVLMGPWGHLFPHEGVPGPKADFLGEATRFWDHWLKGRDTGLMDEPRLRFWMQAHFPPDGVQDTRPGRWVEVDTWPTPDVGEDKFYLNNKALSREAHVGEVMNITSPQTFGSAGGDMMSFAIPGDMPGDGRIDAGGALCFEGAVLSEPLDILGQARLELQVSIDRPQGFLVGLLLDQAPDGTQTLITRGFANLMHRDSDTQPSAVVPGEEMQITVPLHAIGYRVPAGHRLIVQVATAYWPILWPAPAPVTASLRAGRSSLHLPVFHQPANAPEPRDISLGDSSADDGLMTTVREGAMDRTVTTDLTTGLQTQRLFIDGGVFGPVGDIRLEDTGTVMGDISTRTYAIHPGDPLSALARMEQEARFEREDWSVRVRTWSEQTATRTEFVLRAGVECWDGDEAFHKVDWSHRIPRNGT